MSELANVIVVLVEPESFGNVGFVARVLANFGVSRLRIVGTDPREESTAKILAVHAVEILESAEVFNDLESALADVEASWAATARMGGNHSVTRAVVPLTELPDPLSRDGDVALVFGRESNGLSNDEVSLCDLAFTIRVSEGYSSLNLSHAVAVVLYDLFQRNVPIEDPKGPTRARAANRREREQACIFFDELVDLTTIKDFRKPIAKQVFRNLVGRAYMTGREATTLIGTIRKVKELFESKKD